MFSYKFCKISKNTFFAGHLRITASEYSIQNVWLRSKYISVRDLTINLDIKKIDGLDFQHYLKNWVK